MPNQTVTKASWQNTKVQVLIDLASVSVKRCESASCFLVSGTFTFTAHMSPPFSKKD